MTVRNYVVDPARAKLRVSAGHSCSYSNEGGTGDKGHYMGISARKRYDTPFHNVELYLLTLSLLR